MPNTLTEMITGFWPPTKRAARHAELEQAADASATELRNRTTARRDRNTETRTNMQTRRVQDACNSS